MTAGPSCSSEPDRIPIEFRKRSNSLSTTGTGRGRSSWPRPEVTNQPSAPPSPTSHSFHTLSPKSQLLPSVPSPSSSPESSTSSHFSTASSTPSIATSATSDGSSCITSSGSASFAPGASRKSWQDETGEEPGLKAARRALWEDPVDGDKTPASGSSRSEKALSSLASLSVTPGLGLTGDQGFSGRDALERGSSDNPNGDEEVFDENDDEDVDDILLSPILSPSQPSHATLPPLPSCLRTCLPPRSYSSMSSCSSSSLSLSVSSTSNSQSSIVQFSSEPPEEAETYSAVDYIRQGAEPVTKLSMKEWVELRGVREAVGVWSGKIKAYSLLPGNEDAWREKENASPSMSSSCLSLRLDGGGAHGDEVIERKSSCRSLAALAGVRTVGKRTGSLP